MAFEINTEPKVPNWKPDYSPADRQVNYKAILSFIGAFLPLSADGKVEYDEDTKKAEYVGNAPEHGSYSYAWAASDTEDGTYTNISGATSSSYTCTSSESEKYLGVKVTNTLNGVTNTVLIKYGQLPEIAGE